MMTYVVTFRYFANNIEDWQKIILTKIADKAHIGLVNGLYATSVGNGGITVIEAFKTPSDAKLSLFSLSCLLTR